MTAFFATVTGFGLIWHIWWMVGAGLVLAYVGFVWFAWRDEDEYAIPAERGCDGSTAKDGARENNGWRATRNVSDGGMTATATITAPGAPGLHAGADARGHGEGGPASKRVIVGYGFWIFLLSDIIMFSAFFAAHAVLQNATAGGPSGGDLFHPRNVAIETACLLFSSFTCGLSAVGAGARP